jgi:hypothetical protein
MKQTSVEHIERSQLIPGVRRTPRGAQHERTHLGVESSKIPPAVRERTERRIRSYGESRYAGRFLRLSIRFHGALCYIDAHTEPPVPIIRETAALGRLV